MQRNVDLEVENKFLKRKLGQLETKITILIHQKKNRTHTVTCPKCRKKLSRHKGKDCDKGW
ncbi:MAG: hypothetical protein AABY22_30900 [Nanoarchaeota archaeon]